MGSRGSKLAQMAVALLGAKITATLAQASAGSAGKKAGTREEVFKRKRAWHRSLGIS
jgi:hypothetical protein